MSNWIVLVFLILFTCAICGRVALMLGQSRVIGEIIAGILIGPTVMGAWFPQASELILAPQSILVVQALSELGLIMLMAEVPWHAAGAKWKRGMRKAPVLIAVLGILLSFSLGSTIGAWSKASIAPTQPYWAYVIFCGIALSVTALPVLVKIIQGHEGIHVQAGQLAISAAVYADLFAWFALALVLAMQSAIAGGLVEIGFRIVGLTTYGYLTFFLVRPWLRHRAALAVLGKRTRAAVALLYCLFSAHITSMLGFHQAVGAIMAAYVFHDVCSMEQIWRRWISRFGHLFLIPIFFAYSGIQVSLEVFAQPTLWLWLTVFLMGGVLGKVLGSYIGARAAGLKSMLSLEVGILMNTKGLVELVILGVGLQEGVLSESSYSILLVLALVSMILTSPLIKLLHRCSSKNSRRYGPSPDADV